MHQNISSFSPLAELILSLALRKTRMANNSHDIESRISRLTTWATTDGATLHPHIQIFYSPLTSLSFRVNPASSTSFPQWEPIVKLPTRLSLSYLNALSHDSSHIPSCSFHEDIIKKLPPHVTGRLVLVKEFLKGQASFWYPYINALPQPKDSSAWTLAPFWNDDERELLDGTNVQVGIEKIRQDVKDDLRSIERILSMDQILEKGFSRQLYHWAYCIFSSRSFRPSLVLAETESLPAGVKLDDFSVLLPLFDIGNHEMTTDVRWELDASGAVCDLKVGREYQPGEQVFNNYSMKTNAELLLGYGFLIENTEALHNDYTHVRKRGADAQGEEYLISLRPLKDPSSVLGRKRLSEEELRLVDQGVLGGFEHVPPSMVWDIFCVLAPSSSQRDSLIPVPVQENTGFSDAEARDRYQTEQFLSGRVQGEEVQMYLEQTLAIIQHKMMQELERLEETDIEVVGGEVGELGRNIELAMDYRKRCRDVLEAVLESMGAMVVDGEAGA